MFKPTHIIIHHSASPMLTTLPSHIRNWHLDRGFREVGYHCMIDHKGVVHKGRNESEQGAHNKHGGFNRISLGICVIGNFERENPTPQALSALHVQVDTWMKRYDIPIENVLTHKMTGANTLCPGTTLQEAFEQMLEDLK